MLRDSAEKQYLLGLRYALIILDEAHKARSRQGFGKDAGSPNELLAFMRKIAACAEHVLLGHDLAQWHKPSEILPILAGEQRITSPEHAWRLLRSPCRWWNPPKNPAPANSTAPCAVI